MRIFVTGATGFVGMPTVRELLAHGHDVLGLSRSDAGAEALAAAGAQVQRGALDDLDSLRQGAVACDAVIHLAFVHDWSNFAASCETDRQAIRAIGAVLVGTDKPLLATTGLGGLVAYGKVATEQDRIGPHYHFPRQSEQTTLGLTDVRASIVRLPQIHDTIKQGLITPLIGAFLEKKLCVYPDEGRNALAACPVRDAARLYRLAIERGAKGEIYHTVAEEGVTVRAMTETIARRLDLPVQSLPLEDARAFFGNLAPFVGLDMRASSEQTRRTLGWAPTGRGIIADLEELSIPDH